MAPTKPIEYNMIAPYGLENLPPTSADLREEQNEADMLIFANHPENLSSSHAPHSNLLSTGDAGNPCTNPEQFDPQTSTDNLNEAHNDGIGMADRPNLEVTPKKTKRVRGRTKMKTKGRREPWEPKIQLEFDEEGNVCSDNATTFANFCGYAVRKHASLQVESWEKVSDAELKLIFKKIMKHYNIPNNEQIMDKILKSCAKKYRAYRTNLKRKYFDPYKTTEERLKNTPKIMSQEDWAYFVKFFESEDFQVMSQRNKRNIKKKQYHQTLGTSSIAKVKSKMKKEGADSVKYRVYKKAHQRANGDPVDEHSKEMMEKIENLARDKGVDLDSAMEMVLSSRNLSSRKKRDFSEMLQSDTIGTSEGTSDDVRESALARAEKMAIEAQRAAAEAKQRVELLEMQLAQSQQQSLCASRGEAAAKAALAETCGELAGILKEQANIYNRKGPRS